MTSRFAALAAAVGFIPLMVGAPVAAHHAIGATVDTTTEVIHDMVLTRIDWINPHAWFHFNVRQANGALLKDVMIEWLSLAGLKQSGYSRPSDFSVGATYKVTYNPNRDGSPGGHLVRMVDQEGNVYQR